MKNALRLFAGRLLAQLLFWRSQPYAFATTPILVVSPHADDETLGCGGLLALKRARGEPVHVVFVTNSAGSPEAGVNPAMAARRRAEALAALAVLGVPAHQIHFLAAPDGRLNRLDADEADRVTAGLAALLETMRPGEVFMPYLGGGSSEHDATVHLIRAALAAARLTPHLWEYPVWAWWDPRRLIGQLLRPAQNFRLPLGRARNDKQAALACHVSQCQPAGLGQTPALPSVLAALCTGPVEFFFHRT